MGFAPVERVAVRICRLNAVALAVAGILLMGRLQSAASNSPDEIAADFHTRVILIVGAPGENDFSTNFLRQAEQWEKACTQSHCPETTIGLQKDSATNDFELLRLALEHESKDSSADLWLVLVGHGTFDGKEARFNLRGPDITASDMAAWLKPFHRRMAVIDTSSSSAPFLNKLSATNRVIITATRSGNEQNFARFGHYFADAIGDPASDLDKDGQVSLLEAFLMASRRVTEFYKIEGRLATEHALIDDNGDGLGTQADWFEGLRAVKKPQEKAGVDGLLAQQVSLGGAQDNLSGPLRLERDSLERAVLAHREKKSQMQEDQYYQELEKLLLQVARFYETNSTPPGNTNSGAALAQ
jgi:hypothetical protein